MHLILHTYQNQSRNSRNHVANISCRQYIKHRPNSNICFYIFTNVDIIRNYTFEDENMHNKSAFGLLADSYITNSPVSDIGISRPIPFSTEIDTLPLPRAYPREGNWRRLWVAARFCHFPAVASHRTQLHTGSCIQTA